MSRDPIVVLKKGDRHYFEWSRYGSDDIRVNGSIKPERCVGNSGWRVCSEMPALIESLRTPTPIITGYRLKPQFEALKPEIDGDNPLAPTVDVAFFEKYDDSEDRRHGDIFGLYEPITEERSSYWQKEADSFLLAADDVEPFASRYGLTFSHDGLESKFPYKLDFLPQCWHAWPVRISGKRLFSILRVELKQRIPPHCKITSDYDFHLAIEKMLPVSHQETRRVNKRPMSRVAHYVNEPLRSLSQKIIDICDPSHSYGEKIGPLDGNSLAELEDRIDEKIAAYSLLMAEPMRVCNHCKGFGVLSA